MLVVDGELHRNRRDASCVCDEGERVEISGQLSERMWIGTKTMVNREERVCELLKPARLTSETPLLLDLLGDGTRHPDTVPSQTSVSVTDH
jgi:hypothetical protein